MTRVCRYRTNVVSELTVIVLPDGTERVEGLNDNGRSRYTAQHTSRSPVEDFVSGPWYVSDTTFSKKTMNAFRAPETVVVGPGLDRFSWRITVDGPRTVLTRTPTSFDWSIDRFKLIEYWNWKINRFDIIIFDIRANDKKHALEK